MFISTIHQQWIDDCWLSLLQPTS